MVTDAPGAVIHVLDDYPYRNTPNVSDGQHEEVAALIEAQALNQKVSVTKYQP